MCIKVWNETFEFMVPQENDLYLSIHVENCNLGRANDDLGRVVIPLNEIKKEKQTIDEWYTLTNIERGSIHLEITFRPFITQHIMQEQSPDANTNDTTNSNQTNTQHLQSSVITGNGVTISNQTNVKTDSLVSLEHSISNVSVSGASPEKKVLKMTETIKTLTRKVKHPKQLKTPKNYSGWLEVNFFFFLSFFLSFFFFNFVKLI